MEIKTEINTERLIRDLTHLGEIGRESGQLTRLAATDTDRMGRDAVAGWMKEAGMDVRVDRVGNIFGIWATPENQDQASVMVGSHIDTVINAGIYDGCLGVLAGIELIRTLRKSGFVPRRPLVVAVFTNEEGVRYAPDMLGSLVYAGGLAPESALATVGEDGSVFGEELERIGYAGPEEPGFLRPCAFVELHIELGPILDRSGITIGAVETLQGISWQRVTIEGSANHAGTTPMTLRRDAGLAAARVMTFVSDQAIRSGTSVATVGCLRLEPNAINVIPSRAEFTEDLRDPDEVRLEAAEAALADYLGELARQHELTITTERLACFAPVRFSVEIVELIESAAAQRGLSCRRMTSGAGQDAQMMARLCPTAMIFVPSVAGVSHNPDEFTALGDLAAGAGVLLDVVRTLCTQS